MLKYVFVVMLCGNHGSCNNPHEWTQCKVYGVFESKAQAYKYREIWCEEMPLPDCSEQPTPKVQFLFQDPHVTRPKPCRDTSPYDNTHQWRQDP